MSDPHLAAALDALERSAQEPANFYQPFLALLPVSGAAVSTVGKLLGSETVSASDDLALRVDELQFDLGEGPCWDAMNQGRPVLMPDIRASRGRWPAFSAAILECEVASLFAFPLVVGPLKIGAVDLYSIGATTLDTAQTEQAATMANAVGRHVLRRALDTVGGDFDDVGTAHSRRLIHQATGMVLAQLRIPGDDARLVIQGHAFAAGRPMMEVAQEIIDGKLEFTRRETGIEVSE
ncbi:GAF and ANTAR domain-containing protein [Parafrigoribacterium soli]|uniref:GAF and ANTAR domain-containing protein n=1 Tax=Parafrigoribacterium soli TaxID=3144663 RepID=UPI0032ED05B9